MPNPKPKAHFNIDQKPKPPTATLGRCFPQESRRTRQADLCLPGDTLTPLQGFGVWGLGFVGLSGI